MAETEKAEIQSLSTQALYQTFNECLAEIINRGLNVYYSPSENTQDGQAYLNFPIESCGNIRVFEPLETEADTTSSNDISDQHGWTCQDGPRDDEQEEDEESAPDDEQTNCVQNVQHNDSQYDYNASNSEVYMLNSYEGGQQDKIGDLLNNIIIRPALCLLYRCSGYKASQESTFHVNDVNAQSFLPIMAPAAPDYGTSPSTPEDPMSYFFSPVPDSPETLLPSPPLSEEEKWEHAVSFTTAVMNNFPHCKDFPQCFFNPDGPRHIPQTVEEVPTGAPIREVLHARKDQSVSSYHDKVYVTKSTYQMDQRLYKTGPHAPPAPTAQNSPYLYPGSSIPYGSLCNLQNRPYGTIATQFFKEATIPGVGASTDVPPPYVPNCDDYQKTLRQLQNSVPFGDPPNFELLSRCDLPQPTQLLQECSFTAALPIATQDDLQPHQQKQIQFIDGNRDLAHSMFLQQLRTRNDLQSQLTHQETLTQTEEAHFLEKKELKAKMEEMFTNLLDQAKRHWNLQAGYIVSFGISKAKEAGQLQRKITFLDKCVSHQKRRTRNASVNGQKNLMKARQAWNIEKEQIIKHHEKTVQDQLELHQEAQDAWKKEKEQLLQKHKEEMDNQTSAHRTSQQELTSLCNKLQAQNSNLQKMLEEEKRKTMGFEQLKNAHQNLLSKGEEKCQELLLFFSVRNSSKEDGDKKMLSSEPNSSGKSLRRHKRRAPRTSARMRQKRSNAN
ncbi:hypothetical protein CAEBREN_24499 [Caenorhabditis brenneri]|uniref:Uncharacterized protein n=1 Tax=Caenorhabditis brenneri TaxID=135651 RepID=G0MDE6_CAEBE|nr:hypothetical protein CAEBREN_24499 [Caenorhabditis brenneri]